MRGDCSGVDRVELGLRLPLPGLPLADTGFEIVGLDEKRLAGFELHGDSRWEAPVEERVLRHGHRLPRVALHVEAQTLRLGPFERAGMRPKEADVMTAVAGHDDLDSAHLHAVRRRVLLETDPGCLGVHRLV